MDIAVVGVAVSVTLAPRDEIRIPWSAHGTRDKTCFVSCPWPAPCPSYRGRSKTGLRGLHGLSMVRGDNPRTSDNPPYSIVRKPPGSAAPPKARPTSWPSRPGRTGSKLYSGGRLYGLGAAAKPKHVGHEGSARLPPCRLPLPPAK
jgi:hypothetical protein